MLTPYTTPELTARFTSTGMICELGPCCWWIIAHSDELRTGIGTRPISTSSASAADVKLRQNRETESSKSLFFMAFRIYPITGPGKGARRDKRLLVLV